MIVIAIEFMGLEFRVRKAMALGYTTNPKFVNTCKFSDNYIQ